MAFTASDVKALREKTGAGMMDCKKALQENDGDMEAAVDWLRTKGLAAAAKKASRVAAEGLVGIAADGVRAAVVELNAETDFVARNDQFQALVADIATLALDNGASVEALSGAKMANGKTVAESITDAIATIGENMNLRRVAQLSVGQGVIATYVHNTTAPGLGKIGVLVAMESAGDAARLNEVGRQVAMHVAASNPLSLNRDDVDPTVVERERQVLVEQARASGRPENIIEKMVDGRMRKFYEESVLLEQAFVIDPDKSVGKAIEELAKELGTAVACTGFVRMALGEGVEREESDFASEVAATLKKD
ncbi:MAG: elongation factor Ts [Alphaproteobacteria bacterium]|nr:elongation factor Ts [Alphaproteobacteria bacterium]MCB9930065.1 elongation factor Ts [Alphaproteobacteria bacterium]